MGIQRLSASLSGKATAILSLIAAGRDYEQILQAYPDFTKDDICDAADEALKFSESGGVGLIKREKAYSIDEIRTQHAKAYERWSEEEEQTLRDLVSGGHSVVEIAEQLGRKSGAIRSRMMRLGLMGE